TRSTFSGGRLGRGCAPLPCRSSQARDVVVHCFRLLDLLGAVDGLQLFAGLKCLAHAVSVLSKHCLFVSHDLLSALVELDDGLRRFGLEPWRQGARAQMDSGYDVFWRRVRYSPPHRMESLVQ